MNNLHSNNPVSDNDNGWRAFFRAVWRWFRNLFSRSATEAPTPAPASAPVRTQAPVAWSQTESNNYLEDMIGRIVKTRIAEANGLQMARSESDLYKEVTANQNQGRISWGADELNDAVNAALSKRKVVKPAPKKIQVDQTGQTKKINGLEVIWSTNHGSRQLQEGAQGDSSYFNTKKVISEILRTNGDDFYKNADDKKEKITQFSNFPKSAGAKLLSDYINSSGTEHKFLYRGMPKKIENSYDLSTDKQYAAGRFTAATTDRETAASFDPHVVRVSGVATKIPNIFYNGNEREYLFPADAVFDVRKMKDGDVHLKMIMNDRA